MGLIKVRDFAAAVGCTPQNIYKHIRKYREELGGHVIEGRRSLMLDEYACDFIREAMYPKEVSADDTVQRLQNELAEVRGALFQSMQKNMEQATEIMELTGERDKAVFEAGQYQKLLGESEAEKAAKEAAIEEAKAIEAMLQQERDDAAAQAAKEKAAREVAEAINREQAAELDRLRKRGLWARIRNK